MRPAPDKAVSKLETVGNAVNTTSYRDAGAAGIPPIPANRSRRSGTTSEASDLEAGLYEVSGIGHAHDPESDYPDSIRACSLP